MFKQPFTLATTLLTLSVNIGVVTLWQTSSQAETPTSKANRAKLSLNDQQKSNKISKQKLETNLDIFQVNQAELNGLTSVDLPELNINLTPSSSTQIAHNTFRGRASWYGPGFHGRRTANGEIFNSNALTAAHRSLPFGTRVRVTNVRNGRSVVVRINDRGPFIKGRIIDISAGAARRLNMISSGVAPVRLEILGR